MIDFETIIRAALSPLPAVLARIVSSGKSVAGEYVVRNSARDDRRPGSFKINMRTGWWCDLPLSPPLPPMSGLGAGMTPYFDRDEAAALAVHGGRRHLHSIGAPSRPTSR